MIEKFEYIGIWWLPNKPKKEVWGTLRFTHTKGATLELMGSFKDNIQDMNKMLEADIILGVSSNRKEITLYKCFETKYNLPLVSTELSTSSFYVSMIFIGAHFQKPEDIKFRNLSVHYSYLDEWVNISGFGISLPFEKKEIIIKYNPPEPIQATINKDYKIFINVRATPPPISFVQKEACIKQETYIKIEPSEEKSFEEYMNIVQHLRNFLSLGIMEPVQPLAIKGTTESNKIIIGKDITDYPSVDIFYKLSELPDMSKRLMPFDVLFTFRDISEQFESFLKNWFKKIELLEPIYNLYFGTLYNPRMYLENRFLSLVQAIESYHRRVIKNYELPEDRHKKRIAEILNVVPNNHKKWLKWQLKYSNESALRQRLSDILKQNSKVIDEFIDDKKLFIDKITDTRNYLTHYDLSLKEKSVAGEELYRLIERLKIIIEICLLKELGFDFENIKEVISRKYQYIKRK